jgi:hypothetical protein
MKDLAYIIKIRYEKNSYSASRVVLPSQGTIMKAYEKNLP